MTTPYSESKSFTFETIGYVRGCYAEKFGTPRQPGLVPDACGCIELVEPYSSAEAVRGLSGFSHIWVLFIFHEHVDRKWSPTVRPPRLGGSSRVGVLASRSPFRPNPLGMSVVHLDEITVTKGHVTLWISGIDMVDGTPVVDIKPYVPYADAVPDASGAFASNPPSEAMEVVFSQEAEQACMELSARYPHLRELIRRTIALDPRPAHRGAPDAENTGFGMSLFNLNIRWKVQTGYACVSAIDETTERA